MSDKILIHNIADLVTLSPLVKAQRFAKIEESDLGRLKQAWIAIEDQKILEFGTQEPPHQYASFRRIDAKNSLVLPGLVDCHTHPIFGGNRSHEFAKRLQGATYQDIAKAGGGIQYTVAQTKSASDSELLELLLDRLQIFLSNGVTTVEAKSGYGLVLEEEIRLLQILNEAKTKAAQDLSITALALHATHSSFPSAHLQAAFMTKKLLPRLLSDKLATCVDAFVENGYFSVEDVDEFMMRAGDAGLGIRVHADEFGHSGGGYAAAKWGAWSADHLEHTPVGAIKEMAKNRVVAVLLPGTSVYSKIPFAKAGPFVENGCPVALSTDYNPGSSRIENLNFIASLGALHCGLTLAQAIAAVTWVPAFSLRQHGRKGAVEKGFDADLVFHRYATAEDWIAGFGQHKPWKVICKGREF
ncbi:MAG: imidazolonepropionase [Oligoflexales bacterium]